MGLADTSYQSGSTGTSVGAAGTDSTGENRDYWSVGKLKRCYTDYLGAASDEIEEQKNARRYYHGAHWTAAETEALKKRGQPVVTFNRIGRKIDGVVGLLERLRQDPKAFPRTPKHEQGAELATAALRYVLDQQDWKAKSPEVARDGAIDGIGGIEITILDGPHGDKEVEFDIVEPDSFFYDKRSYRMDFSDARFLGLGKWMEVDDAKDFAESIGADKGVIDGIAAGSDSELTSNPDREQHWFTTEGGKQHVRIVDLWYKMRGEWCYCIFSGAGKLMEGKSYLVDEKDKTECRYIMFSGNIDHDGDRYGFVRNMKSANDEINHRRSKGLHELSVRRLIGEMGAVDDIEKTRREAARPDGVVLSNPGLKLEFDDTTRIANIEGAFKFLENAYSEIENFGPNPALIGQGIENKSGRAIQLLQQAGIADLGPYILSYRGWKLRVYRALWNAICRHWTGERWIRVTDDNDVAQFIQINGMQVDPQTGQPTMVNAIGQLDVDIILDESQDSVNMQADAYDTLTVLAGQGAQVPPQVLIELSPLQASVKKRVLGMLEQSQQSNPAQQAQMSEFAAKIEDIQADAKLKQAQTIKTLVEAGQPPEGAPTQPMEPQPYELPPHIQEAQARAEIYATHAKAQHTLAQAAKTEQDAALAPVQFAHDVTADQAAHALAVKQANKPTPSSRA